MKLSHIDATRYWGLLRQFPKNQTFFYDAAGRVKEVHRATLDGQLFHKRVHTYHLEGRMEEKSIYSPEGVFETRYLTIYDDKGQVISRENGEQCKGCYYSKDITV